MQKLNLLEEFFRICSQLANRNVPYALIGGIAVSVHTEPRMTKDIDFLTYHESIADFRTVLEAVGYEECAQPWTFRQNSMTLYRFMKIADDEFIPVDVLVSAEEHYRAIIGRAEDAQWAGGVVKVATAKDLIWLKRRRNSLQDQADIQRLSHDTP